MKKIALLSSYDFHMCCIGFLIELFKDCIIDVYIPNDKELYYSYYKSLYSLTNMSMKEPSLFIKEEYDLSIKITSNDPWLGRDGIISIAHVIEHTDTHNKFICMTPWIKGENITYLFPLYKGIVSKKYNNVITYIGYFTDRLLDEDTKKFINELKDYTFNFIGGDYVEEFNNMKNVRQNRRVDQYGLVELIKESKFILTRKIPFQRTDSYSGSLGHAISHRKPMIIQKYTSESYKLPGIIFDTNYCEIINTIKVMSEEAYENELNKIDECYECLSRNNNEALKNIL